MVVFLRCRFMKVCHCYLQRTVFLALHMLLELFCELISKASTNSTTVDLVQKVPVQTVRQPVSHLLRQRLSLLAISHWPGDRLVDQVVEIVGLEDPFPPCQSTCPIPPFLS